MATQDELLVTLGHAADTAGAVDAFPQKRDLLSLVEFLRKAQLGENWTPNHSAEISIVQASNTWNRVVFLLGIPDYPDEMDTKGLEGGDTRYWFSVPGVENLYFVVVTNQAKQPRERKLLFVKK